MPFVWKKRVRASKIATPPPLSSDDVASRAEAAALAKAVETGREILRNGGTYAEADRTAELVVAAALLSCYRPSDSSKLRDEVANNQSCTSVQTPGRRPRQAGHGAYDTHHSCEGRTYPSQPRVEQGRRRPRRPRRPSKDGLRRRVPVGEGIVNKDSKVHNASTLDNVFQRITSLVDASDERMSFGCSQLRYFFCLENIPSVMSSVCSIESTIFTENDHNGGLERRIDYPHYQYYQNTVEDTVRTTDCPVNSNVGRLRMQRPHPGVTLHPSEGHISPLTLNSSEDIMHESQDRYMPVL